MIDEFRIRNTKFYAGYINPNTNLSYEQLTAIEQEPTPEPKNIEGQFVSDETEKEIPQENEKSNSKTKSQDSQGWFSWSSFILGVIIILFILYLRKRPNRKITHCNYCKTEFDRDDLFCPNCGKKRKKK